MRILFHKGKQRELINKFKVNKKLTWKQLSNFLKINPGGLKAYNEETCLIPQKVYNLLDKKKKYSSFIIEKRKEHWGKIKGGLNSNGRTKKIKIPQESKELAEFYGIMLGDGNSHKTKFYKSRTNKRGIYRIRVTGDSIKDKIYLIGYVAPMIQNLFNIKVIIKDVKHNNAMFIESYGTKLIDFLEKKGFKPGDKIKNKLKIPDWIKNNKRFLIACLRGLYDTDGSAYKLTNQNSYQICFTNYNLFLMKDVRDSLLKLGINCSKISNKDLYITKKSELRKFLKLIGFNNSRHLKKIKVWNLNSPIV